MISFCPVCGKGVKGSFKFCPFCGNSLPVEEHAEAQTGLSPPGSSFQGSKRGLNSSSETSPKKVRWSPTVTSLPPSVRSGCGSSDSEESLNSPERATGTWSRPLTPRGSPQSSRRSPQTLKRSRMTTNLQALPTGTKLTDKKGQHWTLGALQTRDDQGILYEAEPTSALPCESRTEKYRFSLKLDSKDGRLFNEQNFFQRAAKPMQVNKWKKRCLVPFLAIPTCVGFGIHQDKYRFLVFPSLGRSLQSALDDNPKHVLSEKCVLQVAYRLLDALEFIHENEYVHGNLTAGNVFVNPRDLSQVTLMGYGFTFRYCPGGRHVTYKEGSRSPHEGDLEFISVDIHKGCGEGGDLEVISVDIHKGCGEGLNTMTCSSSWTAPCIFSLRQETPEIKGQKRSHDGDWEYKQYPGHVKDLSPSAPRRTGWWPWSSRDMGFRTKVGSFVVLAEVMRAAIGSARNAGGEVGPSITGHEICMVS